MPTTSAAVSVAAALTAGAGLIHGLAAAAHGGGSTLTVAFAVTAAAQVILSVAVAVRPGRATLVAAAVVNLCVAGAWLTSRLSGLPLLDELAERQPFGRQDLIVSVMEVAAAGAALLAARHARPAAARALSPVWAVAALPVLVGATAPHHHPTQPGGGQHAHGVSLASDPIFRGADTSKASEEQLQAARDLIVRTRQAVSRQLSDEPSVVAAGYRSIGDGSGVGSHEHFVNPSYLADGRELDPERVESIVVERTGSGKRIVSAMYILEMGKTLADAPATAPGVAAWHDHQDLCWDPIGLRLAGRLVNGRCVPAGIFVATPPMLHVWLQDHQCGPMAGLDGHGTGCGPSHGH